MAFKSANSRRAFFAGKAAAAKQGMTAAPNLKLPKLPEPQSPDSAPELPAMPKLPRIQQMMKIKKSRM